MKTIYQEVLENFAWLVDQYAEMKCDEKRGKNWEEIIPYFEMVVLSKQLKAEISKHEVTLKGGLMTTAKIKKRAAGILRKRVGCG